MNYEDLILEKDGWIATVTMNRPAKLNALSDNIRQGLCLVADELAKDDEVRVVIVTGAGRGFCAGADVGVLGARKGIDDAETSRQRRLRVAGFYADAFPGLNKPVIAAVNGPAVGAGFSIALSCDIRIASETARFGVAQVARATVPDAGLTYFLPLVVGISKAMELMFTAEIIGAAEAERLGIVSRVVPPDQLMKVTRELADKIAQQAPIPVELTKRMVWRSMFDGLDRQLDLETWGARLCLQTEDSKEAVRAFLEKRGQPQFKGR